MKKPKDIVSLAIKAVKGFVTNVDWADLRENFAIRTRGFRYEPEGTCGKRDYGTKERFASYPTVYQPTPSATTLINGTTIYNQTTRVERDVVACYDSASQMHFFVNDSTSAAAWDTGSWIDLTAKYTAYVKTVDTITITIAVDSAGTVHGVKNSLGATTQLAENHFQYCMVHNTTRNNYAFISASTISVASTTFATITLNKNAALLSWAATDALVIYRNTAIKTCFSAANGATPRVNWAQINEQERLNAYFTDSSTPPASRNSITIKKKAATTYFGTATTPCVMGARWVMEQGGGGLIPSFEEPTYETDHDYLEKGWTSGGSGTIAQSFGVTVRGVGTTFITDLQVGSYLIRVGPIRPVIYRVEAIASDTECTVDLFGSYNASTYLYTTAHDVEIGDGNGYDWLRIGVQVADQGSWDDDQHLCRFYIVAVYDEFQYSDPIYKVVVKSDFAALFPTTTFNFGVDFELMPKNITGLRIYCETTTVAANPLVSSWLDSAANHHLLYDVPFTSAPTDSCVWSGSASDTSQKYRYTFAPPAFTTMYIADRSAGRPLSTDLAHMVDTNRSYITPRYAVRTQRVLNALVVVDQDDATLRVTNVNGSGSAEPDNFPDVTVDSNNNKLKVFLTAAGELLGLAMYDVVVYAFKNSTIEYYDFQSGAQGSMDADVVARKSIISTEDGVFWAGESAIYFLRRGTRFPQIINQPWQNFYKGDLRISEGVGATSYMTSAYREAIISGYDPVYREVWFHSQVNKDAGGSEYLCFRYSVDTELWNMRELNLSGPPVKWFSLLTNRKMSIGTTAKILSYPNIESSYPYQEEVTSGDAQSHRGIPTSHIIHCGSLYSIDSDVVADSLEIDHIGTSTGALSYEVKFYANKESSVMTDSAGTAITKTVPIDSKALPIGIPRRGPLSRFRIYLGLPTTALDDFSIWEINTVVLNAVKRMKIGNK